MKQVTHKRKGQRFLAWLLTLIVIMGSVSLPGGVVRAEVTATQPSGDGTTANPYQIGNEAELKWLRIQVNNSVADMNAKLTADIVVTETWTRIGATEAKAYKDTFDGDGHTISGVSHVYNSNPNGNAAVMFCGLFGYIGSGAVVKNVGVIDSTFSTADGYSVGGIAAYNYGTIENCYSTNNTIKAASSTGAAGGICGVNKAGGVVRYCYTASGTSITGSANGGIVGQNAGVVQYCYNAGEPSGNMTGGIVGDNTMEEAVYGSIVSCYNIGELGNGNTALGGIVGKNQYAANIVDRCFFDKTTTGVNDLYGALSYPTNITNSQGLTTSDFSSGKAAYLLNEGKTDGSQVWYQTLGSDTYPVLRDSTHGTVYQTSGSNYCDGTSSGDASYSNTSGGSSTTIHKGIQAVAAKEPGCTEAGNIAYYKCTGCNKFYSDANGTNEITEASIQRPKTGHTLTEIAAKAATCTTDGNNQYWECGVCGKLYSDKEGTAETTLDAVTIKASGQHDYTKNKDNGDGTHTISCSKCGTVSKTEAHTGGTAACTSDAVCTVCGAKYAPATGHTYGAPEFEWSKTGDSYVAAAVFTCTNSGCTGEGHSKSAACTVDSSVVKAADCTNSGSRVYTATVTVDGYEYTDTKTEIIEAVGHSLTHVPAVAADCENAGNMEYWSCNRCNRLYSDADAVKETTMQNVTVEASGHDYTEYVANETTHSIRCKSCKKVYKTENHTGGTATCHSKAECQKCGAQYGELEAHNYGAPVFNWVEEGSGYTVTAVFTCTNSGCTDSAEGHSKSVNCTVESIVVKDAGCTENGSKVYTAKVTADNGQKYSEEKTDVIPAAGHSMTHVDAVAAGACTGDGNREYWRCTECNKYFLDAGGIEETAWENIIIAAPGHDCRDAVDNGDGTHSASCVRCGEKFDREAHYGGTATCVEKAHCSVCQAEYGGLGDHSYGEPVFHWKETDGGYTVTAVFNCTNAGCTESVDGHTKERNCTVEGLVTKEPACTEKGSKIYKAQLIEDKTYNDSKVVELEALGHNLIQVAAKEASCTENGNKEYWKCSECNKLFADASGTTETTMEAVTLNKLGHSYASPVDNGDGTHSAKCERCQEMFNDEVHCGGTAACYAKAVCEVCGARYGSFADHSYGEPVFVWKASDNGYTVNAVFTCKNDGCTDEADGHAKELDCTVEGPVVTEAASEQDGSKVYTAKVILDGQEYTDVKTDVIPATGTGDNPGGDPSPNPGGSDIGNTESDNGQKLPAVGTKITDNATKAVYEITESSEAGGNVTYVKPNSKTAVKITIPATITIENVSYKVTAVSKSAFANNKKLKTVVIGKNVTDIGDKAFYKCTKLTKLTIPANVKKIGKQAFYGCKSLKSITIKTTKLTTKTVGSKAFKGIHAKAVVKVPKKKLKDYKKLLKAKGVGSKAKIKK